jgi:hypothetical protein
MPTNTALRTLIIATLLALAALVGCATEPEPDTDTTEASDEPGFDADYVVHEELVAADLALDFERLRSKAEVSTTADATRPPDMCGRVECPIARNICCRNKCRPRVPGGRCVDRGGGATE